MQKVIQLSISVPEALIAVNALTGTYPGITLAMNGTRIFAYEDATGPNVFEGEIKSTPQGGSLVEMQSFDHDGVRVAKWVAERLTLV